MSEPLDLATERVVNAIGQPLLEFICAAPLPTAVTSNDCAHLILQMDAILTTLVGEAPDPDAMGAYLRHRLTEELNGETLALTFHRMFIDDTVDAPVGRDALETLVLILAENCYPALLLPPEPLLKEITFPFLFRHQVSTRASSMFVMHSKAKEFCERVIEDPDLGALFVNHSEASGYTTNMIFRSTGHGSSIQLWSLLGIIMSAAWRRNPATFEGGHALAEYCRVALREWRAIREFLKARKPTRVAVQFAFAGVKLPGSGPYEFRDLILRQATADDLMMVPDDLRGRTHNHDANGIEVTIEYAGDIVVEADIPVSIRFAGTPDGSDLIWPSDLPRVDPLEPWRQRLRMSLLLSLEREHRVQIVPSWHLISDPINANPSIGWNDPRSSSGLIPTLLTPEELEHWQTWFDRMARPGVDRISIAIARTLRASGERRDPVDVLIDSVIAWENLFGSSQGEPTLRVTASLAILLEDDLESRQNLRDELAKIYRLRSSAVHGSAQPKEDQLPLCYKALDYAIASIKAILSYRSDLLSEKDGTGRSLRLILGHGSTR